MSKQQIGTVGTDRLVSLAKINYCLQIWSSLIEAVVLAWSGLGLGLSATPVQLCYYLYSFH